MQLDTRYRLVLIRWTLNMSCPTFTAGPCEPDAVIPQVTASLRGRDDFGRRRMPLDRRPGKPDRARRQRAEPRLQRGTGPWQIECHREAIGQCGHGPEIELGCGETRIPNRDPHLPGARRPVIGDHLGAVQGRHGISKCRTVVPLPVQMLNTGALVLAAGNARQSAATASPT